jgi:xanthine dehydrogenase accessory factor
MIHWKETAEIVVRLRETAAVGRRAALATVVRIVGSAYRRPGAKLLIEEDGTTLGSVSGGCLEADVREIAKAVLETGQPWLRHYDTADENILWGLGLGCNGQVDVLVQPATAGAFSGLTPRLDELFAGDAAFALATVLPATLAPPATRGKAASAAEWSGHGDQAVPAGGGFEPAGSMLLVERDDGRDDSLAVAGEPARPPGALGRLLAERARAALAAGVSGVHEAGGQRVFVEVQQPPPHLLVCGAGDDAKPLVAYAADAGFRVTLLDHRPALLDLGWFPQATRRIVARPEDRAVILPPASRSLAVVKTHSLHHDREWVRRLLAAGLPYIGVLGPRARTESILRDVAESCREATADRVFGPVGLDLGADGPRQVAVSIVAELLAFTAHRQPRHLSERREAIHVG